MQALGSSITYMRRYLWQLVLDIIESDSIDNTSGADDAAADSPSPAPTPKPTKKAPGDAGEASGDQDGADRPSL